MIDKNLPASMFEQAAQFIDRLLGINPIFGIAARRMRRTRYMEISATDRARLRSEASVEVFHVHDKILLRPAILELSEPRHVNEIAKSCGSVSWKVTNTYLTDLFDRPIREFQNYLNTALHYACPVELARSGQLYGSGWEALAKELGSKTRLMSLDEFQTASKRAITSSCLPTQQANTCVTCDSSATGGCSVHNQSRTPPRKPQK